MTENDTFSMVGVFASSRPMAEAARQLRALGLNTIEAYTPYPVEQLAETLRLRRGGPLAWTIAVGALVGALCGYFIQYWDEWLNYPLNVGGRPHNSWPAFTVGAFEITLLFAMAAGFFGLWIACGLPRLYDPRFESEVFDRASADRFVLRVEARSREVARESIRQVFAAHGAERIEEAAA